MRILIVTTQDRFFLSHVKERAIYFKNQGCIVGVAAQKTSDDYENKILTLGFSFYDTKIERKSLNFFSQIKSLIRLFKIHSSFQPDISYHLGAKAIFYSTFIGRIFNGKLGIVNAPIGLGYVFTSNSFKAKCLRPILLLFYRFFLNPSKSRVIVENLDDINFFIKKKCLRPKDAFCVLGAGVDTNYFSPLPYSKRNRICTVVMASRLIKEKGVFDFIDAANELRKQKIPVRMQLIGEPDYGNPSSLSEEDMKNIKSNLSIEYLGYQADVAPFLKRAHICCLPSYREGLPRVLVEAASTGLAIITTDAVGCKETVRDNNGFLFHVHDVKRLVFLISYLVSHVDELQKMGENSRKVALTYFETGIISKRTYEIIKTLF